MKKAAFDSDGNATADVVVVGSGVVGAMIADQLAGQGHAVLMLEAGPRIQRAQAVENWRNMPFANRVGSDFQGLFPQSPLAPAPLYFPANNYVGSRGPTAVDSSRATCAWWAAPPGTGPRRAGATCRWTCA
jgi:choline dehydrogenase-like flavoprotein